MAAVWKLASIGIIIVSFLAGFVYYYLLSPLNNEGKKKQLEEMVSLFINFVIFIWVGKVTANFNVFVHDPFAILAYPSHSTAFYIAVLLIIFNIVYKVKRHQFNVYRFIALFTPIFLFATFTFEFIQKIFFNDRISFLHLGLLAMLLILHLLFQGKMNDERLALLLLMAWSIGKIIFVFTTPYTALFGYMLDAWFLGFIFIMFLILYIIHYKRTVA